MEKRGVTVAVDTAVVKVSSYWTAGVFTLNFSSNSFEIIIKSLNPSKVQVSREIWPFPGRSFPSGLNFFLKITTDLWKCCFADLCVIMRIFIRLNLLTPSKRVDLNLQVYPPCLFGLLKDSEHEEQHWRSWPPSAARRARTGSVWPDSGRASVQLLQKWSRDLLEWRQRASRCEIWWKRCSQFHGAGPVSPSVSEATGRWQTSGLALKFCTLVHKLRSSVSGADEPLKVRFSIWSREVRIDEQLY